MSSGLQLSQPERHLSTVQTPAVVLAVALLSGLMPPQVFGQSPDTVLTAESALAQPGEMGIVIAVTTSQSIDVGSTDIRLTFDPTVLQATGVTSTLDNFAFLIDPAGFVTTASASGDGQSFSSGAPLLSVTFNVLGSAPSGCASLTIGDADGGGPDDLLGPIPPIDPLPHILYAAAPGEICIGTCGNGQVDGPEVCDDGNTQQGDCCSAACDEAAASGTTCDDGLFCNGPDACSGGTCSVHPGNPCVGGTVCNSTCNEESDDCFGPSGTVCTDDGNVCTDDVCDGEGTCAHPHNATPCDDGNVCTAGDVCGGGTCRGNAHPCDALGDVDCDGNGATVVDAQVILCLDARRCIDADVPAPCNAPGVRAARGDWDLDDDVDTDDAVTTIGIFVGATSLETTPLGGCCTGLDE